MAIDGYAVSDELGPDYTCRPGCPGYGTVLFSMCIWDCKVCGQKRNFGSHICPKQHNHPVPQLNTWPTEDE